MIFPVVFLALFGVISCQYGQMQEAPQYRSVPEEAAPKNGEPQQRAILTSNGIIPTPYGFQEPYVPTPSRKIYVIRRVPPTPESNIVYSPPVVSTYGAPSYSAPTYTTYSNPALILARNTNPEEAQQAPAEGRQLNMDSFNAASFMRNFAPQQMQQGFMEQPAMMGQL